MVSAFDVSQDKLVKEIATELKKVDTITPPSWSGFVKTGVSKDRPPVQADWWYIRTAAVLLSVYKQKTVGVAKLRTKYGSNKNRGYAPSKFYKASGSIIRKGLQQLDKSGLTKVELKDERKGRKITAKGKSFVDKAAAKIHKAEKPHHVAKKKEAKSEAGTQ